VRRRLSDVCGPPEDPAWLFIAFKIVINGSIALHREGRGADFEPTACFAAMGDPDRITARPQAMNTRDPQWHYAVWPHWDDVLGAEDFLVSITF